MTALERRAVLILAAGILTVCYTAGLSAGAEQTDRNSEVALVYISGPTFLSFLPKDTAGEEAEVLADFYWHVGQVRDALAGTGVAVHHVEARAVLVQYGGVRQSCAAPDIDFGTCLVAPRREPEVFAGVSTDADLMIAARRYFGLEGSPPRLPGRKVGYVIAGGALHAFGHALKPSAPLDLSDPSTEEAILVQIARSPNGRRSVIQFMHRTDERPWGSYDYWLYDSAANASPVRFEVEVGHNAGVAWRGDDLVEVDWGGMGYTISRFISAENLQKRARVDDLLLYDEPRGLYVSFFRDGVEVGLLFSPATENERFPLPLEYTSVVDARLTIEDVEIDGSALYVTHRKADGSLDRVRLLPRVLAEHSPADASPIR